MCVHTAIYRLRTEQQQQQQQQQQGSSSIHALLALASRPTLVQDCRWGGGGDAHAEMPRARPAPPALALPA